MATAPLAPGVVGGSENTPLVCSSSRVGVLSCPCSPSPELTPNGGAIWAGGLPYYTSCGAFSGGLLSTRRARPGVALGWIGGRRVQGGGHLRAAVTTNTHRACPHCKGTYYLLSTPQHRPARPRTGRNLLWRKQNTPQSRD